MVVPCVGGRETKVRRMKINLAPMQKGTLVVAVGVAVALTQASFSVFAAEPDPEVVYDNTTVGSGSFYGTTTYYTGSNLRYEFGDEITLEGFGTIDALGVRGFEFAYTPSESFIPDPDKQGYISFYALDGPEITVAGKTVSTPGTLLTGPIGFQLFGGGGGIVTFDPIVSGLSFLAPRTFCWAVTFEGLASGEDVGLDIFTDPTVGTSYGDFWVRTDEGWTLSVLPGGAVVNPANFYAKVLAIPEPSTMQLALLAGLGLLGSRWMRRR